MVGVANMFMWHAYLLVMLLFNLTTCSGIWRAPDTVPVGGGCEAPATCSAIGLQYGWRG